MFVARPALFSGLQLGPQWVPDIDEPPLMIPHLCAVLPPCPLYLVEQKGSIGVLTCVSVRPRQEGSGAVGSRGAALIQPAVVAGDSNGGVWVLRRTPSTDA